MTSSSDDESLSSSEEDEDEDGRRNRINRHLIPTATEHRAPFYMLETT